MLPPFTQSQRAIITLWYLVQHSLPSFYKLTAYFGSAESAVCPAHLARWSELKLHSNHLKRAQQFHTAEEQEKFNLLLAQIQHYSDFILCVDEENYPQQLLPYVDKPPILFGQGHAQALLQPQIAIVGSRKTSPSGQQITYDFAVFLAQQGFCIISGLAQGIDAAAHRGGLTQQRTIAVMATGLDLTYPAMHHNLRRDIVQQQGAIITEFLPTTAPLKHHFPQRNRLVSGLSLGVLVAEAALNSGSLITARLAAEQGKLVFAIPGAIYSPYHQGCHQLIREGVILVDQPQQILEDLALPTQWHLQQNTAPASTAIAVPEHLLHLYHQLDWTGQDLDQLSLKTQLPCAQLSGQLMELELLGLSIQQSGRYLRCRQAQ